MTQRQVGHYTRDGGETPGGGVPSHLPTPCFLPGKGGKGGNSRLSLSAEQCYPAPRGNTPLLAGYTREMGGELLDD